MFFMVINVFTKSKIINNWLDLIISETNNIIEFNVHKTIFSFTNELSIKSKFTIAIIDTDFEYYFHYTNEIIKVNEKCKFVGVGIEKNCDNLLTKINNHITGYLSIHNKSHEVIQCINEIEDQNFYFDNIAVNQIINLLKKENIVAKDKQPRDETASLINKNRDISISALTEKESKVCKLLTQGYSYKEIAEIIGYTTYTVNQKSKNIYKKLGVRSRAELSYKILN